MKSVFLGDTLETLFLIPLIWMYSDLGGADTESHKVRDTLNGLGVTAFNASAATIAFAPRAPSSPASSFLQPSVLYSNPTYPLWHAVVFLLLCTTISTQDLPDLPGDVARNRRTLPIAHGEPAARRWLAVLIAFWSVVCPAFWRTGWWGYGVVGGMGAVMAGRILLLRNVDADARTWKMWCAWAVCVYLLPVGAWWIDGGRAV
ncbi:hypothetical protein M1830_009786 [Neofusicoccum parvum]|uniref:Uncharacterized protein n=1 Tax=Neofusicoccum parvum TaxID=310453 RepID=A0ACB5S4Q2_9PEZI|nr:hypothetical protein M1830_009786 [Neofusicoccum parvum]